MPKGSFEFSIYKQRHIALKIIYFGWQYQGLAHQPMTENTIEGQLIKALLKTCLIESLETCMLVRCGRTDKGVSSYGQVINLNVRSNLTDESNQINIGLFKPENYVEKGRKNPTGNLEELDYPSMLNNVLPEDIRVLAWSPVARNFSSRFNCVSREYSYVFPIGNLCIKSMEEGLQYLVGKHDFRNLCTFDMTNSVFEHQREILSTSINPVEETTSGPLANRHDYQYYRITIIGKAFLYHQIRCIMTIVFLIGARKEQPTLIQSLLDLDKCSSKPMYNHSSYLPLSLRTCSFRNEDLPLGWLDNQRVLTNLRRHLKQMWFEYKTKTIMIEDVLRDIEDKLDECNEDNQESWTEFNICCDNRSSRNYIQILKRKRHDSLESRIECTKEKRKAKLLKSEI